MSTDDTFHGPYYPILQLRVDDGSIWAEDGELIGRAADGERVSIGVTHDRAAAERYLATHPTPDTW